MIYSEINGAGTPMPSVRVRDGGSVDVEGADPAAVGPVVRGAGDGFGYGAGRF